MTDGYPIGSIVYGLIPNRRLGTYAAAVVTLRVISMVQRYDCSYVDMMKPGAELDGGRRFSVYGHEVEVLDCNQPRVLELLRQGVDSLPTNRHVWPLANLRSNWPDASQEASYVG